jgi:hypothetical protein
MSATIHTGPRKRSSVRGMNRTFASIAVAMTVPVVALIFVVIEERRSVLPEDPMIPEVVLIIPALSFTSQGSESETSRGKSAALSNMSTVASTHINLRTYQPKAPDSRR